MKNSHIYSLIALLAGLGLLYSSQVFAETSVYAAGENFITNYDIERVENDSPVGWYGVGVDFETEFSVDSVEAYQGKGSLKISNTNSEILQYGPPNWATDITVDIPKNKIVTLTTYVKTQNVKGLAAVAVQCWKEKMIISFGSTQQKNPLSGNNPWTKVSFSLRIPEETEKIRVLCMLAGTGEAWFDEVKLVEGGKLIKAGALSQLAPGQKVGLWGGIAGAVIGVGLGILGTLCAKNKKKYQAITIKALGAVTFLGAASLVVGIYAYIVGVMHRDYRYGLVLGGVISLLAGGVNLIYHLRDRRQVEAFKGKVSEME